VGEQEKEEVGAGMEQSKREGMNPTGREGSKQGA